MIPAKFLHSKQRRKRRAASKHPFCVPKQVDRQRRDKEEESSKASKGTWQVRVMEAHKLKHTLLDGMIGYYS